MVLRPAQKDPSFVLPFHLDYRPYQFGKRRHLLTDGIINL
jgi:hypothetical protein